mmetsp:Transcript_79479/g.123951  ORF Transcript_79479/g.123951 Transcript_79479/m.123951 type:complete len:174 (-) Transcript_79479:40-561(-)
MRLAYNYRETLRSKHCYMKKRDLTKWIYLTTIDQPIWKLKMVHSSVSMPMNRCLFVCFLQVTNRSFPRLWKNVTTVKQATQLLPCLQMQIYGLLQLLDLMKARWLPKKPILGLEAVAEKGAKQRIQEGLMNNHQQFLRQWLTSPQSSDLPLSDVPNNFPMLVVFASDLWICSI